MKTNLAYIGDVIEREVAAEEAGDLSRVATPPVKRAASHGFPLPAQVVQVQELARVRDQRGQVISEYRKRAAALRVRLMEQGITPLAVLPAALWHRICDETNLFRMAPDLQGEVCMSYDAVQQLRGEDRGDVVSSILAALASLGFIYLMWGTMSFQNPDQVVGAALVISCCFVAGIILGAVASSFNTRVLAQRRYQRNVRALLASNTWPQVLRMLAPNLRLWGGSWRQRVQLPEPPADVADIILRAANMRSTMYVAAEAGAIGFVGGVEKLFGAGYEQLLEQEAAARHDPIIYVQSGSNACTYDGDCNTAVAIIAQFGDFPVEKEVVDRLVAGGRLF